MNRISKIIGFLFGGLFAVLLAGGAFMLAGWDGQTLRAELSRDMRERCDRQIAMESPPRLVFRPGPTLVIEGLAVGERDKPGIAVRVGRVEAGLALWPLLTGKRVLTRLSFRDADVHLQRYTDGRYSLADLEQCVTDNPAWTDKLRFQSVEVVQGRFDYQDAQHGDPIKLERISLSTGSLVTGARGRLRGEASLTQAPGTASGGITLDLAYRLDKKGFDIESAQASFRGNAWGITALDTELSARGGHGELGHALALHKVVLRADGRVGTATLSAKASAEDFQGRDATWMLQKLKAELRLADGTARTEATLEANAINPRPPAEPGDAMKASFHIRNDRRETEGTLNARIAFRPAPNLLEFDALDARWTGVAVTPRTGNWRGQLGGRLAFSLLGTRGEGNLLVGLDNAKFRASGDFDLSRPVPWRVDIDAERGDPDRIATALGADGTRDLLVRLMSQKSAGTVRAANLNLGGLRATRVEGSYASEGGRLQFNPLAVQLYGGTLVGRANFEPASGHFDLQQQLAGVDLAALLQDARRALPLRGKLSGVWTLEGTAGRWDKVASLLAGSAQLRLQEGEWLGTDVADLLRAVRPALKTHDARERPTQPREKTALSELSLGCRFAGGTLTCDQFSAQTPWVRMGGQGTLQWRNAVLDWALRVAVQSQGPIPRDLLGLRRVMVPFRLVGSVTRPTFRLDWAASPRTLVKPVPKPAPRAAPEAGAAG